MSLRTAASQILRRRTISEDRKGYEKGIAWVDAKVAEGADALKLEAWANYRPRKDAFVHGVEDRCEVLLSASRGKAQALSTIELYGKAAQAGSKDAKFYLLGILADTEDEEIVTACRKALGKE